MLSRTMVFALVFGIGLVPAIAAAQTKDRRHILKSGFTEQEADCWATTARVAGLFFRLPILHESDKADVAQAIHVVQTKLLSRPTYRKYLKLAGAKRAKPKPAPKLDEAAIKKERQLAVRCGLTEKEADCWQACVQLHAQMARLPVLHISDQHEIGQAIRAVQNRLMSRPAYRKYLQLQRQGKKQADGAGVFRDTDSGLPRRQQHLPGISVEKDGSSHRVATKYYHKHGPAGTLIFRILAVESATLAGLAGSAGHGSIIPVAPLIRMGAEPNCPFPFEVFVPKKN